MSLEMLRELFRRVAMSAVSRQISVSGRFVRRELGLTSFQLGRLAREVEEGALPGVTVVRQGRKRRIRFVIDKQYWLDEDN